jgi:hypothetical protein
MKTTSIGLILLVVILAAAGLYYYSSGMMPGVIPIQYGTTTSTSQSPSPAQGTAVFSISDMAPDMGSVTSIKITVDNVQIHSSAQGWVNVSTTTQTYDLIQLKNNGNSALLANVNLQPGFYDQVRLHVSSATVTNANGTSDAKLPSGDIRFDANVNITSSSTTSLNFDFLANESIHVTGNNKYILAPVVHFQSRHDASVTIDSDNNVHVGGGEVEADTKVGMDVNGNVGVGMEIGSNSTLSIDARGNIRNINIGI